MSRRPADLRYTPTHEWVRLEGDTATVGITDYAVEHLGDLVFVQLPDPGRRLRAGETAAEVESVKAVGEVYAPVDGEVLEVNETLASDQAPLASDPFGAGWLFRVRAGARAGEGLMDHGAYERHVASAGGPG
jgi:glycine cleavage system H protein